MCTHTHARTTRCALIPACGNAGMHTDVTAQGAGVAHSPAAFSRSPIPAVHFPRIPTTSSKQRPNIHWRVSERPLQPVSHYRCLPGQCAVADSTEKCDVAALPAQQPRRQRQHHCHIRYNTRTMSAVASPESRPAQYQRKPAPGSALACRVLHTRMRKHYHMPARPVSSSSSSITILHPEHDHLRHQLHCTAGRRPRRPHARANRAARRHSH